MNPSRAKIRDLPPGTRFRYDFGRVAVLDALGPSGARIRYEGARRDVSFDVKSGDEVVDHVAFTAPGRIVVVSDDSLVTVLEG
jgi:hypothetical protein